MKKMAVVLLLVLSLVLSGCSLVVKDPEVDARQVILSVNGETVNKAAFAATYNAMMNQEYQMQQMYQMYGMRAPEINPEQVLERTRDRTIRDIIIRQKAAELKLDQLSADEEKELQAQVDSQWQSLLDQVKAQYFSETELEGDALNQELERYAADLGLSREATAESERAIFISGKLEKDSTKDVTVPPEDVKADFDAKVEANKASYDADPNAYGTAVNGGQKVYFAPAGYRMVKQVLIKFLPEDQSKIDAIKADQTGAQTALDTAVQAKAANAEALVAEGLSEEDKKALEEKGAELQATLDEAQAKVDKLAQDLLAATNAGYEAILPKAQEVYNKAKTEPFDDLVKEYNEDKGMPERGYAVRRGFTNFDDAFVVPAMDLENVGDVAEPSQGIYGYYIVQYAAEVPEGPVDYESVKDSLHDALLTAKKTKTWEDAVTGWTGAAQIETHLDRMSN